MNRKIIISVDSSCDISEDIKEKHNIKTAPFHINIDGKEYLDGIDINADDIYIKYAEKRILPKTSAVGIGEYVDYFNEFVKYGYDVVHINMSSAMSCAYANCCVAAQEVGNVYNIDSKNLSSGLGILALEAVDFIEKGLTAKQIREQLEILVPRTNVSFILDSLEFMRAGGRCSAVAALGANVLKIKPFIEVDNKSGKMAVGKKYRGNLDKVLTEYVKDDLKDNLNIVNRRVFITHSGIDNMYIELISDVMRDLIDFKEIYVTRAGCTVSSHCGPNTIGLIFLNKDI